MKVPLVAFLALVVACGGRAPTAPAERTAPLVISGAPSTFALGTTEQLRAAPSTSAANCTVQWTSSVPAVLSIAPDGTATAQSPGDAEITAACGAARSSIHARVSSLRAVTIAAGAAIPVRVGATTDMTSLGFAGTPPVWNLCGATWQSSRPEVATVAPSGARSVVTGRAPGTATITATCDGVSASTEVTVAAGWTVNVSLNEVAPVSMSIVGTVEVLTGPRAGTKSQAFSFGFARFTDMEFPFRVRVTADEYQDAEFDITADNVTFFPQLSTAEIRLLMKPLPPPRDTDEFILRLGATESRTVRFAPRGAGAVSAQIRFELDFNDLLRVELRCDDALLASGVVRSGRSPALGGSVPRACAGEFKITPSVNAVEVALRLRLTYPH